LARKKENGDVEEGLNTALVKFAARTLRNDVYQNK